MWLWSKAPLPWPGSESAARNYTLKGGTWGDNPGDSINVMRGWEYYNDNY